MTKLKILSTVLACVLLSACSDPKDYKLPDKISAITEDANLKSNVEKLSDEDKKTFVGYVMRATMAESFGSPLEKASTVGQAITIQQKWLDEKKAREQRENDLKEEVMKKKTEALNAMNSILDTSLISLELIEEKYSKKFKLTLALKNNSEKDLAGAKGIVSFSDMFGTLIKNVGLSIPHEIKAGESIKYWAMFDHNRFMDEDALLASLSIDKIKYEWKPDTYIFEDGSKLDMPN